MKLFAFQRSYDEDFDPYYVFAEDKEEAVKKIREAYPSTSFYIYVLKEIPFPGLSGKDIKGIHTLEPLGWLN